jgi:hypothetical protein
MNATVKMSLSLMGMAVLLSSSAASAEDAKIQHGNVGGYTGARTEPGHEEFNAGFSFYSAVWPLQRDYPGRRYRAGLQSGLFGTWMGVQNDRTPPIERFYTKIEGGLGWWRGTEFGTETPKFHMGGVELNFRGWANGPGAGKGRDWNNPQGQYGVAQLSPWLLFPLDGLNFEQGSCGGLFGYGYLPLPLAEPKSKTAGKDVPTGNQCWTLFVNAANFKGPVAFFTPYFWSRASVEDPRLAGMFLDSRPSTHNRPLSMETQHIPWVQAADSTGLYGRMNKTLYPIGPDGNTVVLHRAVSYSRKALWDGVKAWFDGGDPVDGAINPEGEYLHEFTGQGGSRWRVFRADVPNEQAPSVVTDTYMEPFSPDPTTFGFQWDSDVVTRTQLETGTCVTLPEYYRFEKANDQDKGRWVPIKPGEVPAETGLAGVSFSRPADERGEDLGTPEDPQSCWKTPGPAAGPFKVKLGDGSTVTYYWYRFADQPALLNADLTDAERESMQKRVEKLHRHWSRDRNYLTPATVGRLAHVDPAQIVTPPAGMAVGYVPIATHQGME